MSLRISRRLPRLIFICLACCGLIRSTRRPCSKVLWSGHKFVQGVVLLLSPLDLLVKLFDRFVIEYIIAVTADDVHLEWLSIGHGTSSHLLLYFVLVHSLLLIELLKFECKLLSMLLLKLLIWDFLKAQTIVPFVVNCFNQVLLKRFSLVFLPKVFNCFR